MQICTQVLNSQQAIVNGREWIAKREEGRFSFLQWNLKLLSEKNNEVAQL